MAIRKDTMAPLPLVVLTHSVLGERIFLVAYSRIKKQTFSNNNKKQAMLQKCILVMPTSNTQNKISKDLFYVCMNILKHFK